MNKYELETLNIYDAVFFFDTLSFDEPYISLAPRNHESLFFVTDGTLLYEKNNKAEIVKKGQVGYIARGSKDVSSAYKCQSVSYMVVNFNFDKNNMLPQKSLPFKTVCSSTKSHEYEKLFKKALDEYSLDLPGTNTICTGILLQLLGMLYKQYILSDFNNVQKNELEPAINYIQKNFHNSCLKISELASICNMSDKHFRRLFAEAYHKNPHVFLRDFRLNKAKVLLLNTAKTITEISLLCGFSDVYSFTHCFKNNLGVSPSKYRNATKN